MSLAALFTFFVLSRSEPSAVPYFSPVQIMRPSADHHGLVATEDLARILGAREQMAVIAVVGPYHSGKSFLLNALAGRTDVFKVGPSTDPETKGLYIARTDRRTEDGKEIWLLDSEGFFGPQVPEEYDAKVFTVAACCPTNSSTTQSRSLTRTLSTDSNCSSAELPCSTQKRSKRKACRRPRSRPATSS